MTHTLSASGDLFRSRVSSYTSVCACLQIDPRRCAGSPVRPFSDVALELRASRPFVMQRRRGDQPDSGVGGSSLGPRRDMTIHEGFIAFAYLHRLWPALARCSIHQRRRRLVAWTRAHTFTCPSRSAASVSSRSAGWTRMVIFVDPRCVHTGDVCRFLVSATQSPRRAVEAT